MNLTAERPVRAAAFRHQFLAGLRKLSNRHQLWRVFADFCLLAGCAVRQRAGAADPGVEERYLGTAKTYTADELSEFCRLLAVLTEALGSADAGDFLGSVFQELDLGSHWHGQYFTPWELCRLSAEMTVPSTAEVLAQGHVTMHEPAVGAGAQVLAAAHTLRARGLEPAYCLFVEAWDVDETAALMAYLQLSLTGIPGLVVCGNSLSQERRWTWPSLTYAALRWDLRLAMRSGRTGEISGAHEAVVEAQRPALPLSAPEQLSLFGGPAA